MIKDSLKLKIKVENDGFKNDSNEEYSRLTRVVEIKPLYESDGVDEKGNAKYKVDTAHMRVVCSDIIKTMYQTEGGIENKNLPKYVLKYATIDKRISVDNQRKAYIIDYERKPRKLHPLPRGRKRKERSDPRCGGQILPAGEYP